MINIGYPGAAITEANLQILNEGLVAIAGSDQAVTREEMDDLVHHLESHGLPDGGEITMGLPNEAGSVDLRRLMGSWHVVTIRGPVEVFF